MLLSYNSNKSQSNGWESETIWVFSLFSFSLAPCCDSRNFGCDVRWFHNLSRTGTPWDDARDF